MKTIQIQTAAKMLAVLAAALTMTGCIWFDWDFGHHHHRDDNSGHGKFLEHGGQDGYFLQGAENETPAYLSGSGVRPLRVTWNVPIDTTAGEGQATPEVGITNCVCGDMCQTICGANCPMYQGKYCPVRRGTVPSPLPPLPMPGP